MYYSKNKYRKPKNIYSNLNVATNRDYTSSAFKNSKASSNHKLALIKKYYIPYLCILGLIIWIFSGAHNRHVSYDDHTISTILPIKNQSNGNSNDEIANIIEENTSKINSNQSHIKTVTSKINKNDSLSTIFAKYNIKSEDLYSLVSNKAINKEIKKIKAGENIELSFDTRNNHLSNLNYQIDSFRVLQIKRDSNNNLIGNIVKLNLTKKEKFVKLEIKSSLFEDALKQNLPINLIIQLSEIFAWDIDFAQDIRTGDYVELLYEDYYHNENFHSTGQILAATFNNNGNEYSAIKFGDSKHSDYYTPDGLSLRKAFLRSPVKFTRISSKFSLGRKHPILHKIRAHRGVDYAAPTGTPIKAAGDGKIIHYGRKGGYGKAAILQHGKQYTTLYGHMSKYNSKLKKGAYVKQGDIIGYVGQTGLASGPHLHFEFRVNNVHKNPLTVALPKAKPIAPSLKPDYKQHATILLSKIQNYSRNIDLNNTMIATNEYFE